MKYIFVQSLPVVDGQRDRLSNVPEVLGKDIVVFEAEHALDWEDGWFTTDAEPGASGNAYLQVDPGTAFGAGRCLGDPAEEHACWVPRRTWR